MFLAVCHTATVRLFAPVAGITQSQGLALRIARNVLAMTLQIVDGLIKPFLPFDALGTQVL